MLHFKSGAEEVEAANDGDYGTIELSTSEKARLIRHIIGLYQGGMLKTTNSSGYLTFAGRDLDAVKVLVEVAEKFLYVQRGLMKRRSGRTTLEVNDEYDAQDLLGALLPLFFDNVKPEDYSPNAAGSSTRIDFVLPDHKIAVELKHSRKSMTSGSLGDELMADAEGYGARGDVSHIVALVFDHDGWLSNPAGLERDLSHPTANGTRMTVRIIDR